MGINSLIIYFRTDASIDIGSGHVMRCLTLAEALQREGHHCLFICRNHEGHLAHFIMQKGFEYHLLNSADQSKMFKTDEPRLTHSNWLGVSWQTDAQQTLEVVAHKPPDWLIVDHYALDAKWEHQLAEAVGQIMVIDDLADREHECTVLLDQNLGRDYADYKQLIPSNCKMLIGPKYALLRPAFAELRPGSLERRRSQGLKRILISLGGVDRTNMTSEVLEALIKSALHEDTELDIVMGGAAPHVESVKKQASQLPYQTTVSIDVNDMAERMSRADLAIGAAGVTAWERCCLGLPCILLTLAENQVSGTQALVKSGAAVSLEKNIPLNSSLPSLLESLKNNSETLSRMAKAAAQLTNGEGTTKVCRTLLYSDDISHE